MTAVTTAASGVIGSGLGRLTFFLLLAFVASLQVSIAAANILLAITAVLWLVLLGRGQVPRVAPSFLLPLVLYGVATLVSAAFSLDPGASLIDSRQLLLFAVVPLVCSVTPRDRAGTVLTVVVTVGAASAVFGIVQYALLHYDALGRRPDGALTHYMTYSGTLMLALCVTTAQLVFDTRERTWPALVLPALVVALLPIVVALLAALAPDAVTNRMLSIFDLRDPSNRDRLAMMRTATAIIRDDPWTGVGPNMVPEVYERYRDADAVNADTPHLHNVPLQIAAERGLPALAIWCWFVAACAVALVRRLRGPGEKTTAAAALAALAAMLAAGLFEYNFGDSEFLMLFLVLIALPFAAGPQRNPTR